MTRSLVIFTACFPYGIKSETFLESEIEVLSGYFEQIIVIPCARDGDQIRAVPPNVVVSNILVDRPPRPGHRILFKNWRRFASVYASCWSASASNAYHYTVAARYYFSHLLGELEYCEVIEKFVQERGLKDAIFYTYWFDQCLTAVCVLKAEGRITRLVSRAHRFDLYDDRQQGLQIAFRDYKLKHSDRVFCISQHGLDYLQSKTPSKRHSKIKLSYLGVRGSEQPGPAEALDVPLIVSVSSLIAIKRVALLAKALRHYGGDLRWIHFGSGREAGTVEKLCAQLPPNVRWDLAGHVENSALLAYYKTHHVDLFVSLSESEGLPVSMMEAISFGIPVMACRVGGIPEIVIERKTGLLLDVDSDEVLIAQSMKTALDASFDRGVIRNFFLNTFEAETNYSKFARALNF